MSMRADEVIDRRRLRRKLSFWRVVAVGLIVLALAGAALWSLDPASYARWEKGAALDHIARVKIEGTITEDEDLLERLDAIAKADRVKGVILSIDSPGGTTAGGEAIYEAVRKVAAHKPVVAQVGTLAASAGYMIASGADQIVARQSSIVGSIGVLVQIPNFAGTLDKLGVRVDEVKSSPLKAEPSPFNETTEPERAMLRSMILDSYDWFVGLVAERRPLSREEVLALADGSIFTGRQALQRKLVDKLGGEDEAKAWLVEKGVSADLEVVEWKPRNQGSFLLSAMGSLMKIAGLSDSLIELSGRLGSDRMFLDGLVSVWQPE
ncbi:MAG: signal peptide peptidase SppA [Methylobacterium mesophilicum]|nr:signal peptide peptidase SppA [Methylobacterium mesophilicum]